MTALIVDDDPISTIVLRDALEDLGYEVLECETAEDAWDLLQKRPIRLVIADWLMPGMSGIQLSQRIRFAEFNSYTYIILLTTYAEKQDRIDSIRAGVDDFLSKPLSRADLEVCLIVANRILGMEERLQEANRSLEQTRQVIERARLKELEIGKRIQETLLYGQAPYGHRFFETATFSLASSHIDGDFVEFFDHTDDVLDVLIGDGMGKGLTAALLCAGTKAQFQRALTRLLVSRKKGGLPSPREIVQFVHNHLSRELVDLESFVTLTYIRLDAKAREATVVDCGHMPPIFWDGLARKASILETEGNFPLGFTTSETYRERKFRFQPGDAIILYSDGLTEAKSPDGEEFGVPRLMETVVENDHLPLQEFIDKVRDTVIEFKQTDRFDDDFTCVIVQSKKDVPRTMILDRSHASLLELRSYIASSAAQAGLPRANSQEMQLAAHELFRNLVEHASEVHETPVKIGYQASASQYEFTFEFDGEPFHHANSSLPELSEYPEEGFGLYIIENSVDEMVNEVIAEGRTKVTLRKSIPVTF